MRYRFRPNKAQKADYKERADALHDWIAGEGRKHLAEIAMTGTVYFTLNGSRYRVGSHKPGINYNGETNFHAAPTRAPEIFAALKAGKTLNKRGIIQQD